MAKGFKVVRDYLYESWIREGRADGETSTVGKESKDYIPGNDTFRCKLYDDDGILYYEAVCIGEEGAIRFHNWGSYYAGTTFSKIRKIGRGEQWEDFIG